MVGKAEEVYNILKEKIIKFELPPSSEITDELLGELNVSKTPLREAIIQLEREGFIRINPRKGTVVTEVTRELIDNVYEVRLQIEPYIARTYYKNVDTEKLREIKTKLLGYTPEEHASRNYYIELDNELHDLILDTCSNTFLYRMMNAVNGHNRRIREQTSLKNEDYIHAVNQHLTIIDSIEMKNPDAIEAAVKYHILWGRKDAHDYLDKPGILS